MKFMKQILMSKLYGYIRDNNPDILMALQDEGKLTTYIDDKVSSMSTIIKQWQEDDRPDYIIEEASLALLTEDLRPSKFHYLNNILEEEFESKWLELNSNGLLRYEVINIVNACETVFQEVDFTEENEDDKQLRYATIGSIAYYFEQQV